MVGARGWPRFERLFPLESDSIADVGMESNVKAEMKKFSHIGEGRKAKGCSQE